MALSEAEIDKYINKEVRPTLERLVAHLIHRKPDDPIPYMLHYLEKKKGIASKPLTSSERIELTKLQNEWEKLKTQIKNIENEQNEDEGDDEENYGEENHKAASSKSKIW